MSERLPQCVRSGTGPPAEGTTNAVLQPHVIRYNGTVPTKLTGWPKYENYRAPEHFQDIARALALPAATPQEHVESLACAVERLRDAVGIEPSFQALGIDDPSSTRCPSRP